MEIKGTAVRSIGEYVKNNYPDRYQEWFSSLTPESQKIISSVITAGWYPVKDAAVIPTQTIGKVFFGGDIKKAAWMSGRYSAESALTGIYKLYVKFSTPMHIIDRAGRIFQAYYQPSEIETANKIKNGVNLRITKFPEPDKTIDYRIAGWIEKALEISGCQNVKVQVIKSLTKGDPVTEFEMKWE
ncbi:MAG: hypothetical protein ACOCXD_00450 [Bacteroidota bacterium]